MNVSRNREVLVIEDHPVHHMNAQMEIEDHGLDYVAAYTLDEARDRLHVYANDLVVPAGILLDGNISSNTGRTPARDARILYGEMRRLSRDDFDLTRVTWGFSSDTLSDKIPGFPIDRDLGKLALETIVQQIAAHAPLQ